MPDGIHRSIWFYNSFICNVKCASINWHCSLMLSHPFTPLSAGCRTKSSSVDSDNSIQSPVRGYMINFPSYSTVMLLNRICGDQHNPRKPVDPWPTTHTWIHLFIQFMLLDINRSPAPWIRFKNSAGRICHLKESNRVACWLQSLRPFSLSYEDQFPFNTQSPSFRQTSLIKLVLLSLPSQVNMRIWIRSNFTRALITVQNKW